MRGSSGLQVSLACAFINLLIRPMEAGNHDVAALPPAASAEPANDSSPVPTTTCVSLCSGPLLPGVQTLTGFFLSCMTDRLHNIVGPTYPVYGTLDYGQMFDQTKMTHYSRIVHEFSPRHGNAHEVEGLVAECINQGPRVSEDQRQALYIIMREFLHLQWLSDAILASLNLARTAFAAISEEEQPGVQTAIFSWGCTTRQSGLSKRL